MFYKMVGVLFGSIPLRKKNGGWGGGGGKKKKGKKNVKE